MSVELSITLPLALLVWAIFKLGFELRETHAVWRNLYVSLGQILMVVTVWIGYKFADSAGYSDVSEVLITLDGLLVVLLVMFIAYLFLIYFRDVFGLFAGERFEGF